MDRYQNIVSGKVWKCCRVLSLLELRAAFPYLWESWKTVGTMEYFKDKFRLRESLELCRMWEKNFCCGKLSDWRRGKEGGTRDGSKWDLKTLWTKRPSKERNIRVSVRTCLGSRLQKAPLSNILCQFWGEIDKVNYPQQHCLFSFISLVSDTVFCGKHLFNREFATRRIHA